MILDMQVDPEEYPESDSGQDQEQEWLTDPENFYSVDCSLSATNLKQKSKDIPFDFKLLPH